MMMRKTNNKHVTVQPHLFSLWSLKRTKERHPAPTHTHISTCISITYICQGGVFALTHARLHRCGAGSPWLRHVCG